VPKGQQGSLNHPSGGSSFNLLCAYLETSGGTSENKAYLALVSTPRGEKTGDQQAQCHCDAGRNRNTNL